MEEEVGGEAEVDQHFLEHEIRYIYNVEKKQGLLFSFDFCFHPSVNTY